MYVYSMSFFPTKFPFFDVLNVCELFGDSMEQRNFGKQIIIIP